MTVTGAKYADLTVAANITLPPVGTGNGKSQLVAPPMRIFNELCKEWSENKTTVVRISQIETHLLTADCVVNVDGTTVNGDTKNIERCGRDSAADTSASVRREKEAQDSPAADPAENLQL